MGGRPKGSVNKDRAMMRGMIEAALGKSIPDEIMQNYHSLRNPLDKLDIMLQVAPYCYPKLASMEIQADVSSSEMTETLEKAVQWLTEIKELK